VARALLPAVPAFLPAYRDDETCPFTHSFAGSEL